MNVSEQIEWNYSGDLSYELIIPQKLNKYVPARGLWWVFLISRSLFSVSTITVLVINSKLMVLFPAEITLLKEVTNDKFNYVIVI